MKLLVSIIVPCYNQAQYLNECLESVLGQTYSNWECIIVNDGSTDSVEKVSKEWVKKDSRFKYLYQENTGLSSARNLGLNNAKGDFIQFLDADDIIDAKKILNSISAIKTYEIPSVIVTNFKMFQFDKFDNLKPYCELKAQYLSFDQILYGWDFKFTIPIHCGLFSSFLLKDFQFPEHIKAKEDWIMWLFIFQKKVNAIFLDETLVFYRSHDASMTKDNKHMLENTLKALEYLDEVIQPAKYKSYLFYFLKSKIEQYEILKSELNYANETKSAYMNKLKSRKFVLNLFFKTFFGFTIFRLKN
jgi:glycosyltransferase involved in cell wall biosynthesis